MRQFCPIIESSLANLPNVSTTHCQAIKLGIIGDTYTANNIIAGYSRIRELRIALQVFDEIPHRDTVSWNSLIAGFVNCGNFESAWEVLKCMKRSGFGFDAYTFGSILKGVAYNELSFVGQQVHSNIVKTGNEGNMYSASALLDMYAKCHKVEDAHKCFKSMPDRNSVSWNALIAGYAEKGDCGNSFQLFNCMHREGVRLEDGTFAPLLTLLDNPQFYRLTMQLHCIIIKHGLEFDNTALNATITAYSKCGSIDDAKRVFDAAFGIRDLVTWNSMLAACLAHDEEALAFNLFEEMQVLGFEPDIYTYTSIISACFEEAYQSQGKSLHALVIKRGLENLTPISNSLMAMYLGSTGTHMEYAIRIFDSMELKDRVSWNSMLTGFSQYGLSENALKLFQKMQFGHLETDHYAFSAVLRSCADLATLNLGQQIHGLALRSGFESNEFVASSLIFMYSKCGVIEDAKRSFEASHNHTSVTWNSIMFGYAQHGQGQVALDLFSQMKEKKVKMDHITFVAVLTACSHIGLVEEGCDFLKLMESHYGISPRMEHYACAIDLLGRAGRLKEAKEVIEAMPFHPDAMVWKTLLGACRLCADVELATKVASWLLELEPDEHCTYVLLSDLYGHLKRWDEIAIVKRMMRERGVKKVPGWSWIEVHNQLHAFNAEDHSHVHNEEIYQMLRQLMEDITNIESGSDHLGSLMDDFDSID